MSSRCLNSLASPSAVPALLFVLSANLCAQADSEPTSEPITIGVRETLHSDILDEDREIWLHVPSGAREEGANREGHKRYPVLVLLDGPAHFHHTTGTIDFLVGNNMMPEVIVAAVANTDRTRDLTPFADDQMTGAMLGGGAEDFLSFLCDELIPSIDARYPTAPMRLLIGHSFGGLFAMHALSARPGFFQGIVAISPSMQWGDQQMVEQVDRWLQDPATRELSPTSIYMTVGNEGIGLLGGTMKASGLFAEQGPPSLRWKFTHHPDESHGSVVYPSTVGGLRWIFEGWRLSDATGVWERGGVAAIEAHYGRLEERLGLEVGVPETLFGDMIFKLASANRAKDCLALIDDLGPERVPFPPDVFAILANVVFPKSDLESRRRALSIGLERAPGDPTLRQAAENLGMELPPMPAESENGGEEQAGGGG
ncbi:MAG: alpha/beta hydrolase-fold protein [Planctomycetota bacterium]